MKGPFRWLRFDYRIVVLVLLAGLPGSVVGLLLLWTGDFATVVQWTGSGVIVAAWFGFALATRSTVVRPLQTLANLLSALRHEDYSIEARGADRNDPLGLALAELNDLREVMRDQRLGAIEATALLRRVMAEIDVAVYAFDSDARLRLVNRAGERLLDHSARRLLGSPAQELGLEFCLEGETPRTFDAAFPGAGGRWELRRSNFREGGRIHQLLVLSDLSRVLREEERQAWRRLIRVLSHEINNSLTPIHSIAGTLSDLLERQPAPPDREDDLKEGLDVISRRAEALQRFMTSYARLARLPSPEPERMGVESWVRRVAKLETRCDVQVRPGPDMSLEADGDQLDQLLLNLVQNAADAVNETDGQVEVGWQRRKDHVEVWVLDEGPGLANPANLFVPFFTTKPHGSGIGLVLSRQIAEGHGGSLVLENRSDGPGCKARVLLPLEAEVSEENGSSRGEEVAED